MARGRRLLRRSAQVGPAPGFRGAPADVVPGVAGGNLFQLQMKGVLFGLLCSPVGVSLVVP